MKRLAFLALAFVIPLAALAALPPPKVVVVGYDLDSACSPDLFDEQMHEQVVAVETLFAAHGRSITISLVPVKLAPAPLAGDDLNADASTIEWAKAQQAAHPEVDYLILGTERSIRFSRLASGVGVKGVTAAYNLTGTKVCLMNVRLTTRNVFAHEFTHHLGYHGTASDAVHSKDEENLMAVHSLNQWGVDEQILRLWDAFQSVAERQN